jgi:glycosyltransferase involved in cell wall biosynthesis
MPSINILFDATTLVNDFDKNSARSGIFFAAYNILLNLKRHDVFKIILYVRHKNVVGKMKQHESFSTFQYSSFINGGEFRTNILMHKRNISNAKGLIEKSILALKIIKNYLLLAHYQHKRVSFWKNIDVFFSPSFADRDEVLEYPHIIHCILLHDAIPVLFPEYYPEIDLKDDYDGYVRQLRMLSKNNYYFCNSECTKRDFLKLFGCQLDANKMFVTHIAGSHQFFPDYDRTKLAAVFEHYNIHCQKDTKYIFSLCTLEPRKNLLFTLRCFVKFIKKHQIHDVYFFLAGAYWESFIAKLEECIDNFDECRDKIVRLGYVDDEDVNILYSNSLFFTYLSQYEGFGVPPLEAMQAGTPVITSNNSSLPEVVGDAAITIDYDSEEQCIKAFEDLYFNESLRKEYIAKGIERAKLFSWEKTVNKMTDVIMAVVSSE